MPAHHGVQLNALRRDERGFTLIEVLMTTAILAVVLTAVLNVLDTTAKLAPRDQERGDVIRETQVGVQRMTRELRHAYKVDDAGPWSITASLYRNGATTEVTYDCTGVDPDWEHYRVCNRSQSGGGGVEEPVIEHVILDTPEGGESPPDIFTYRTNAAGLVRVADLQPGTVDLRRMHDDAAFEVRRME